MKIVSLPGLPLEPVSHNPEIQKRVMLRKGDLPHLTNFSQATFTPGQTASAHTHSDMVEVFLVTAGSGVIILNGVTYPLAPGTCIAVETNEVHEIQNNGREPLVLTYFGIKV